jgi:phosphate transport system permease protein
MFNAGLLCGPIWLSVFRPVSVVEPALAAPDQPRVLSKSVSRADRVFRGISASAAITSLFIIGATAVFLLLSSREVLAKVGVVKFFTTSTWNSSTASFGVLGLLVGTIIIATVAIAVGVPLAVGLALFVNEYAPPRIRRFLVSAIDLLAAVPSLAFGIWGRFALAEPLKGVSQFFADHLSAIPFFRVVANADLTKSSFAVGVVVGIMVVPIITSVSRDVMAQCPREQCEGALALGGSRWGMIRSVILPFSRSGVVGAILLGFGRALGETIAITLMITLTVQANSRVLSAGGGSIAAWIATRFPEATGIEISALVAAGLALFVLTLLVNLAARRVVNRARSAT